MTQVDFYVADGAPIGALHHIVARLCIKAIAARKRTWVRIAPDQDAAALVDYLWGFSPNSFIASTSVGQHEAQHPVCVGTTPPATDTDVVINIAPNPVDTAYPRIIEIVVEDDALKQQRRDAWVFYKQQGYAARRTEINVRAGA